MTVSDPLVLKNREGLASKATHKPGDLPEY